MKKMRDSLWKKVSESEETGESRFLFLRAKFLILYLEKSKHNIL